MTLFHIRWVHDNDTMQNKKECNKYEHPFGTSHVYMYPVCPDSLFDSVTVRPSISSDVYLSVHLLVLFFVCFISHLSGIPPIHVSKCWYFPYVLCFTFVVCSLCPITMYVSDGLDVCMSVRTFIRSYFWLEFLACFWSLGYVYGRKGERVNGTAEYVCVIRRKTVKKKTWQFVHKLCS